ncbi:DUF1345 domain-containing protein [Streptomyces polyrhachis]|uniref:DUF1345 domain-containing protein n=1 Tax=Streptomyces polyrhachis TaxID=1282885 RepID=A0ABW2GJ58_9ACTN
MKTPQRPLSYSALYRLAGSTLLGVLVGVTVGLSTRGALGLLSGITAGATLFVATGWLVMWPMDAEKTRANVRREDFQPFVEELAVITSSVGALIVVVMMLLLGKSHGSHIGVAIALAGVFMSWASLHLMYAARYAYIYYEVTHGGIDFNNDDPPAYGDFLYFSYNLGMTYQVADTNVSAPRIRQVVLRQCLLSYLFGTCILAIAINLVAGIVG